MRSFSLLILAIWLCLAGSVYADDSSSAQSPPTDAPPADATAPAPPTGPTLQPSDNTPTICDPGSSRLRFVEVRGTGFDAWATQRLVGNVVDGNGVTQMQWGSVWVSPQGRLTLEVNLCADPFRNRPALPVGNYTVSVGPGTGAAIAATSISLAPPAAPPAEGDVTAPDATGGDNPAPASPAAGPATNLAQPPMNSPTTATQPPPTAAQPPAAAAQAPATAAQPRTGPGSMQQPLPLGAPGNLVDGWQLVVTGVTPDAWSGIHASIASSVPPAPDQRDFMVRVQATYLGQSTGVFSAMRLAVLSNVQTTYDQLHNGCGIVPDMVPPNLVLSGGLVRGNVCFAVRASDIDSVVLFDNQSADNDRVYFALK